MSNGQAPCVAYQPTGQMDAHYCNYDHVAVRTMRVTGIQGGLPSSNPFQNQFLQISSAFGSGQLLWVGKGAVAGWEFPIVTAKREDQYRSISDRYHDQSEALQLNYPSVKGHQKVEEYEKLPFWYKFRVSVPNDPRSFRTEVSAPWIVSHSLPAFHSGANEWLGQLWPYDLNFAKKFDVSTQGVKWEGSTGSWEFNSANAPRKASLTRFPSPSDGLGAHSHIARFGAWGGSDGASFISDGTSTTGFRRHKGD
jgi:hypothetical protein